MCIFFLVANKDYSKSLIDVLNENRTAKAFVISPVLFSHDCQT